VLALCPLEGRTGVAGVDARRSTSVMRAPATSVMSMRSAVTTRTVREAHRTTGTNGSRSSTGTLSPHRPARALPTARLHGRRRPARQAGRLGAVLQPAAAARRTRRQDSLRGAQGESEPPRRIDFAGRRRWSRRPVSPWPSHRPASGNRKTEVAWEGAGDVFSCGDGESLQPQSVSRAFDPYTCASACGSAVNAVADGTSRPGSPTGRSSRGTASREPGSARCGRVEAA
jgi:hypothetical protein